MTGPLTSLSPGQEIPYGGDRVAVVDEQLAEAFRPGDRLVVVQDSGRLLRVPATQHELVHGAVTDAVSGFAGLASCTDEQITAFFDGFAARLSDDDVIARIAEVNSADVDAARSRGRSTTRLVLDEKMRRGMVEGLLGWRDAKVERDVVVDTIEHDGWSVEARRAPLGVVGFVFEGRPNVFADACGVVRTGNAVVFRIGSDALGTATAIVEHALTPSLRDAGLPEGAVRLVGSPERSAGHALFSDRRLALAVARGSGPAVAELGAVARQAGIPVSLHGTGGAWIVAGEGAESDVLRAAVHHSLDRKVCNTLNVAVVLRANAGAAATAVVDGLRAAADERGVPPRLHVVGDAGRLVPGDEFERTVRITRADGAHDEPAVSELPEERLAEEWEWESSPEMTLVEAADLDHAIALCNRYSPHFIASLVSDRHDEQDRFYEAVDAPFVANGFTRWVDGQYALRRPELGLSNWEGGRMLGRGAILSGDGVHTVRYRARVTDPSVRR